MKNYTKPVVTVNDNISEGVYMASGCYTTTAYIYQTPEAGRGDYRIQVNGTHKTDHTKDAQILTITFNQPVQYVSCNAQGAELSSGDGTTTLEIRLSYHQNPTDNIGFGDLVVTSEAGLSIISVSITD